MSHALKLILMSTATIITCIVITIAKEFANQGCKLSKVAGNRIIEMQKELEEADFLQYDGCYVYGADVVNFMKKQLGSIQSDQVGPVDIIVVTSLEPYRSFIYNNVTYLEEVQNFASERYIKPIHQFLGQVIRNENDVITEVRFVVRIGGND